MLDRARLVGLLLTGLGLAVACSRSGFEDQYVPPYGGVGGTAGAEAGPGTGGAGGSPVGGFGGVGGGPTGGFGGTGGVPPTGGAGGLPPTGGAGGSPVGGFGGVGGGPTGGFGGVGGGPTGGFGGTGAVGGFGGGPTDGGNFFDAFPFPDSGPIASCVQCADQSCNSQVNTCYNNPTCASGVVCALTSCLGGGGGGLNFSCVIGCFGGNFSAAAQAFQAFLCVSSNCGQQCVGAITGGGGGLPGGGGAPPPPTPGGAPASFNPVAGGYLVSVPADMAKVLGVPAGPLYVPPLEVLDSVPVSGAACGPNGASCR